MSFLLFAVDNPAFQLKRLCLIECELRQIPLQSECLATLIRIIIEAQKLARGEQTEARGELHGGV